MQEISQHEKRKTNVAKGMATKKEIIVIIKDADKPVVVQILSTLNVIEDDLKIARLEFI